MARRLSRSWPAAGEALARRAETYNRQLEAAIAAEKEGRVLIIAPDDISAMKTLTRDHATVERLYRKGYEDAAAIGPFLVRA